MIIVPGFLKQSGKLKIPEARAQKSNPFTGAFYVIGSENDGRLKIKVDRGYVNGLEPVTKKNELIGGDENSQPEIEETAAYDSINRCYICIKMAVDEKTGLMAAKKQSDVKSSNLTIVAVDDFHSNDKTIHFHPIAIAIKDHGIKQLAYHDLLHVAIKQYGIFRHFMIAS